MRLHRLPRARGDADPCARPVGRFCHWFEHPSPPVRPEPDGVGRRRRELLAGLDSGAVRLPGSRWIAGQRVRYLVEAGLPDSAVSAARACRAGGGWCDALAGYALHAAGRDEAAETAFDAWLAALPPEARCRATDLSPLLEGDLRGRFRDLPCPDLRRRLFVRRFWWLADPLYLVPGNERRAEDLSRRVLDRVVEDAATPFRVSWGADLSELLLRYGWPAWWERRPRDPVRPGSGERAVAHDAPHARSFLPRRDVWATAGSLDSAAWDLEDQRPRASYAVAYADTFASLPHRIRLFRRGDSVLLLAAYAFADTATGPVQAALVLADRPEGGLARAAAASVPRRGVLAVRTPARPALLSLEILDREARAAARARYGLPLRPLVPGVPSISGLLAGPPGPPRGGPEPAHGRGASAAEDPALAAAGRMRLAGPGPGAAPRVTAGDSVRLYWELYGLGAGGPPHRVEVGLRGPGGRSFLRLAWSEEPGRRAGPSSHRLSVSLPRDLPAGPVIVRVTVEVPGWTPIEASAPLRVAPPRPCGRPPRWNYGGRGAY